MEHTNTILVERRGAERLAVNLDVLIHPYRATPILCLMHDVSTGGALLTTYAPCGLTPGDEVLVEADSMEMVATIAWMTDGSCGIRFHRRLYPSEVDALRNIAEDQAPFVAAIPQGVVQMAMH